MNKNVEKLLNLQEIDNTTREKKRRITRLEEREENLQNEIEMIKNREEERQENLAKLKQESEEKNRKVDDLQGQIEKYRERLDEGIISFKETEALEEKIQHSTDRMEKLEDEAIDIMMEIDRTEAKREEQKAKAESKVKGKKDTIEGLEEEKNELLQELEELEKEREEVLSEIPDRLIDQYNRLRASTNTPVVQVKNGVCQGCQMSVSKNTVKQARNDQGLAICENCSRILYLR